MIIDEPTSGAGERNELALFLDMKSFYVRAGGALSFGRWLASVPFLDDYTYGKENF